MVVRGAAGLLSVIAVAVVSVVAVLSWCQGRPGSSGASGASERAADPAGIGAVFLGVGECSSFGTATFTEVSCTGERAAARVVARHDGKVSEGPLCPATTDFVLHISESRPAYDEDGDGTVPQGYACMRKLQAPHPGDPGGGGGPRTIVGDCVYGTGEGEVRETSCDGEGRHEPEYEVASAVGERSGCPPSTALYVRLGGNDPVGCARPV